MKKFSHILEGAQFADLGILDDIFRRADELAAQDASRSLEKTLEDRIVACLFFEPSTRTRLSFSAGAEKLGAGVISMDNPASSSAAKGESLKDTVRTVAGFSDCIVLRHPDSGSAQAAAAVSGVPVINAGDGSNEHPTQALYDLYTIKKELGRIDALTVAFLADFRYQRNIHSLVPLLCLFKHLKLLFISPPALRLPEQYKQMLSVAGVAFEEHDSLESVWPDIDILYVTRIVKERFPTVEEYERYKDAFHVTPESVKQMKEKSAILHVMPRVNEIDPAVDTDPRAAYFRQAKHGMYVRMALLELVLK